MTRSSWRRLLFAWTVCALPRAALAGLVGLDEDYGFFVHGRTNSAWYPLYQALAGGLWWLSGGRIGLYFAAHLVIHASIGPIVLALVEKLGLGARAAWLAVFGVALMPYYASLSARQPQVGIAVSLFALLVLAFASWAAAPASTRLALAAAGLAGLMVTLRPNAIASIAVLYALVWILGKRGAAKVALSAAVFLFLLLGLAIANLEREGRFSPFTGNAGFNLYVGNNPRVAEYALRYDITSLQDALSEELPQGYAATPVEQRDALLRRAALDYIAAHPWGSLWNAVLKSWRYWDVRLEDAQLTPLYWNLAYTVPYVVYLLLAFVGAWELWRQGPRPALALIVAVLLSYWLPHAILYGAVRMRMTTEFLLIVLAAHAAAEWLRRGR